MSIYSHFSWVYYLDHFSHLTVWVIYCVLPAKLWLQNAESVSHNLLVLVLLTALMWRCHFKSQYLVIWHILFTFAVISNHVLLSVSNMFVFSHLIPCWTCRQVCNVLEWSDPLYCRGQYCDWCIFIQSEMLLLMMSLSRGGLRRAFCVWTSGESQQ